MSPIQHIQQGVRTTRLMTLGLVEGIPYEQWTCQPFPGANHVAWSLLHILLAEDWGPTALGDNRRMWEDRYRPLEQRGPLPDLAEYPSRDQMLEALTETHTRFVHRLSGLTAADLTRPTVGALQEFAPDLGSLMFSHVWHEGFHSGQISVVRKALGLPPRFG